MRDIEIIVGVCLEQIVTNYLFYPASRCTRT